MIATPAQPRSTRSLRLIQSVMGFGSMAAIGFPFLRRVHGMENVDISRNHLFVSNHVSLLDTVLLGGLLWSKGCCPILTLGDRAVWQASPIRRLLSRHVGFLMDRSRLNSRRVAELETFAKAGSEFQLLVFPEGTRGNGVNVGPCRPGLHVVAHASRLPIVPIFIENMQKVSTKSGRFHPVSGLRQVEVHFGNPISTGKYLQYEREAFGEFIRNSIASLGSRSESTHECSTDILPEPIPAEETRG